MKFKWRFLIGILSFSLTAFCWEFLAYKNIINLFILPPPNKIVHTFFELIQNKELIHHLTSSLFRVGLGFFMAMIIAIPIGLLLSLNRISYSILFPLLNFLRPIPPIAWMPLAILWFGIGHGPAIFLTMIASFFSVLLGTMFGISEISNDHLNVARCFEASKWLTFKSIIIPAMLPQVLNSLRIGFGLSWMAVVGAEMISSNSGLGHMIIVAQDSLRSDIVIVGMITIGATGIFLDLVFKGLTNHLVIWKDYDKN